MDVARTRGAISEAPELWYRLAGWWPLQESGGAKAFDVSGYGNNGTLTNIPVSNWIVSGRLRHRALNMPDANDCVSVPHSAALIPAECSVAAWASPTAFDTTVLASKGDSGVTRVDYDLRFEGADGYPQFAFYDGAWRKAVSTTASSANTRYQLVGTWDGTNCRIYRNGGLEQDTTPGGTMPATSGQLFLGNYSLGLVYSCEGPLANVAIWSRALAASAIQCLYADPWCMGRLRRRVFPAAAVAAFIPYPYPRHELTGGLAI